MLRLENITKYILLFILLCSLGACNPQMYARTERDIGTVVLLYLAGGELLLMLIPFLVAKSTTENKIIKAVAGTLLFLGIFGLGLLVFILVGLSVYCISNGFIDLLIFNLLIFAVPAYFFYLTNKSWNSTQKASKKTTYDSLIENNDDL